MAPKKASGSSKAGEEKRKVVRKTIEFKKELITKYESGVHISVLAKEFGLEQIKVIYINSNGKNCFGFRTNRFSNSLLERIMFENRGLTVLGTATCMSW